MQCHRSIFWSQVPLRLALALLSTGMPGFAQAIQSGFRIVWEWKSTTPWNEDGKAATVSRDGLLVAHLGPEAGADGLYIKNLATGEDKMIVHGLAKAGEPALAIGDVCFSPVEGRLMFLGATGFTQYYLHQIYSVRVDGSDLVKMKVGQHDKATDIDVDLSKPQYSPDGSKILVQVETTHAWELQGESVAMLNADAGEQIVEKLTDGDPLFWSVDGSAVYYRKSSGEIARYDIKAKQTTVSLGWNKTVIFGRVPGADAMFYMKDDRRRKDYSCNTDCSVAVASLDGTPADPQFTAFARGVPLRDSEGRDLRSISGAGPHQLLLTYDDGFRQDNLVVKTP